MRNAIHIRGFVTLAVLAGAVFCGHADVFADAMVTDVQAKTGSENVDATAAFGPFNGNDKQSLVGQLNTGLFSGFDSGWSIFGASDESGNGPFTDNPGGSTGMLLLDANVAPIDGPFVLALKGGADLLRVPV